MASLALRSLHRRRCRSSFASACSILPAAVCAVLIVVNNNDFVGSAPIGNEGFFTAPRVFMKDHHGVHIFTTETGKDEEAGVRQHIGMAADGDIKEKTVTGDADIVKQCHGTSSKFRVRIISHFSKPIRYEVGVDGSGNAMQKKLRADEANEGDYIDIGKGKMAFILWNADCSADERSKPSRYEVHTGGLAAASGRKMATLLYHWGEIDSLWHGLVGINSDTTAIFLSLRPWIHSYRGDKDTAHHAAHTMKEVDQPGDFWEFYIILRDGKLLKTVKDHIRAGEHGENGEAAAPGTHKPHDGQIAEASEP